MLNRQQQSSVFLSAAASQDVWAESETSPALDGLSNSFLSFFVKKNKKQFKLSENTYDRSVFLKKSEGYIVVPNVSSTELLHKRKI